MTDQELLARWASEKYGIALDRIGFVDFEDTPVDGGYSAVTPGFGDVTEVTIYGKGGGVLSAQAETDTGDLIVDVCRFAAGLIDERNNNE